MKLNLVALAAATVGVLGGLSSASAQTYGTQEIDQSRVLTVAAPGTTLVPHRLYVVEQISDARPCFEIVGSNPGEVNPLWTTFDFSGICSRAADTNGYSIRVGNEDLGVRYRLQIRQSGNDLLLLGIPTDGSSSLQIGRAGGISSTGFTQIVLNPGWRLTKRTFEGRTLGHNYFTNNLTLAQLLAQDGPVVVEPPTTPTPTPPATLPFADIRGDVYATEIARAVDIGFIAGFGDGRFGPREGVTREQAVSMIVEAMAKKYPQIMVPTQVGAQVFPDVPTTRWSAAKINFVARLGIVAGDQAGTFRPGAPVKRVELMAMLRRMAEYEQQLAGLPTTLAPTHTARSFTDIGGHWGRDLITMMSGYCQVATPLNESGQAFHPEATALRNYASAAIVRLYDCTRPAP
ncbi:DUF3747 domain-containing protein [Leptolyngbya sp. PCC 6406]|uniref:DUF3747 domain-containing protein n=1 Tax=Leptolyngbya sp. PCC 6406 TaxID=1173264 RepID=UPI00031C520F|nr:DUF3747 domain-containing protein [Leptolyngbya sp. PCC 6406]